MNLRHIILCTIALGVFGCAPPPASAPNEAQVQAAVAAWRACFVRAAAAYDDGRSDATTIAVAIVPVCSREQHSYAAVIADALPTAAAREMYWNRVQEHPEVAIGVATNIVLGARRPASAR